MHNTHSKRIIKESMDMMTSIGNVNKEFNYTLTAKELTCIFWQHRNFGQVRVTRDLHILG